MIIYISNKIIFDKINFNNNYLKKIKNKLIRDYDELITNLPNENINKNNLINHFKWMGMSSLWFNNTYKKDIESENKWANRLLILYLLNDFDKLKVTTDDLILFKSIKQNFGIKRVTLKEKKIISNNFRILKNNFYINFLYFVFINLIQLLFFKIINYVNLKIVNDKSYVWIRCLYPVNCKIDNYKLTDRNYYLKYFEEKNFFCLVKFKTYTKISLLNMFMQLRKIKNIKNVELVDRFFSVKDLISCAFSNYLDYKKSIVLFKNNQFLNLIKLNNLKINYVFEDLWFSTFHYSCSATYKLDALKCSNFFKRFDKPQTYFTYGEFFINNRPIYQLIKNQKKNHKIVTIQHSYNFKNYSTINNNKKIFDYSLMPKNYKCPFPDLFFVQGMHYFNILKKFYPIEKIFVLGNQKDTILKKNNLSNANCDQKVLITSSVADLEIILSFFDSKFLKFKNIQFDLKLHPSFTINKKFLQFFYKNEYHKYINLIPQMVNVYEIVNNYKVLICCHSNFILESFKYVNLLQRIRLQRKEDFEFFDDEKNLHTLYSKNDLYNFFNKFKINKNLNSDLKNRYEYYFELVNNNKYNKSLQMLQN